MTAAASCFRLGSRPPKAQEYGPRTGGFISAPLGTCAISNSRRGTGFQTEKAPRSRQDWYSNWYSKIGEHGEHGEYGQVVVNGVIPLRCRKL